MHDTCLSAKLLNPIEGTQLEPRPSDSLDHFRWPNLGMRAKHARAGAVFALFQLSRISSHAGPTEVQANIGSNGSIALLYGQLILRRLRKVWQRARSRRNLRHAVLDMDERLMNDIGLPPEHIRTVLRHRPAAPDKGLW